MPFWCLKITCETLQMLFFFFYVIWNIIIEFLLSLSATNFNIVSTLYGLYKTLPSVGLFSYSIVHIICIQSSELIFMGPYDVNYISGYILAKSVMVLSGKQHIFIIKSKRQR